MYSSFAMIAPRMAMQAFDRGIEIELVTEHWWDVSLFVLKELLKIDYAKTSKVILQNVSKFIEKINSLTALEFNERHVIDVLKISRTA